MSKDTRQLAVSDADVIGKERMKKRLSFWESYFERFEEKTINSINEESDLEENFLEAYSDPKFKSIEEEHNKVRDLLLQEHGISKDELSLRRDRNEDGEQDNISETDPNCDTDTEAATDIDNAMNSDYDEDDAGAMHDRESSSHFSNREIISKNNRDAENLLIQQSKGRELLLQAPASEDKFADAQGKVSCGENGVRNCNKGCALTTGIDDQKELGNKAYGGRDFAKSSPKGKENINVISGICMQHSNEPKVEQTRQKENLNQETVVKNKVSWVRFRLQGSPLLTRSFMQKGQHGKNVSLVGNAKVQFHCNSSIEGTPMSCKKGRNINQTKNTPLPQFVQDSGLQHSLPRRLNPDKRGESNKCHRKIYEGSQSPEICTQKRDPLNIDEPLSPIVNLVTKFKEYSPERPQSKKRLSMNRTKNDTEQLQNATPQQDTISKLLENKADIIEKYDQYELWKLHKRRQSGQRGSLHIVSNLDEEPTDENKYVRVLSPVVSKPVLTPRRFSLKKPTYHITLV
ncbi:tRNA pseudouridine synthase A [Frankliniella fusca]|uniref:tRNA pseudouridine synthase A n=1 Tax=Frankliniella fusca TaxID=407009 RepID=A0AAE1GXD8_9NEOP|nr:tRNA pseudouridine synthase A [Frankliniella fusca]